MSDPSQFDVYLGNEAFESALVAPGPRPQQLGYLSRRCGLHQSNYIEGRCGSHCQLKLGASLKQIVRSRIEPTKKIARSLRQHRELILNYFRVQKLTSRG